MTSVYNKPEPFEFPGQTGFYRGKVRDVYYFPDKLVTVVSDRISAFDIVLPLTIPHKGAVLNGIAAELLQATADRVPNWLISVPDPNVMIGKNCHPFKIEMVIRGYLAGHAWRTYKAGKRELCGVALPEGLKENDKLPEPIITPSTKADAGHDEDISKEEILSKGLATPEQYTRLEEYTRLLFKRGSAMAAERGLLLVDTKYEFGLHDGNITLIDEIHTPDSSRYFYADYYDELQAKGTPQKQLSKEFVRQWLIDHDFQGRPDDQMPEMDDAFVESVSRRYIELYEKLLGRPFKQPENGDTTERIYQNILKAL